MSDKVSPRALDPEGVANGDYVVTVAGGHVTGLTPATSGSGSGVVETIVPGAGISVDSTDPANPVVSATGAGGGGGTGKDRRWNPPGGATVIDEFNDDSIDAAWLRVDPTGAAAANATWAEGADSLAVKNTGGDSSQAMHALLRPLGTSMTIGDGIVTFLTIHARLNVSTAMGGLILADGSTPATGNQVCGLAYTSAADGNNTQVVNYAFTNFTAATAGSTDNYLVPARGIYLRLWKTAATTWQVDTSPDGVLWSRAAFVTKSFTPTHVGVVSSSYGTATKHIISYEFLRRVSGITATTA